MGRSVMTLADSIVAYQTFEPSHYCDEHDSFDSECGCETFCESYCDHSEDFRDLLDWVQEGVIRMFPSMTAADRWIGRELHVIAENAHSVVTISEYCDLVSICLGANYDRDTYWRDPSPALGEHWRSQVESRFLAAFNEYSKIGTFSNGESVYQKIGA